MNKLTIQRMRQLCNEEGLINYDKFIEWFMKRFPNECCESYFCEWVGRFKSGDPVAYMDNDSKRLYVEVFIDSRR